MSSRAPRWGCLAVLAACNLVFWLAVAVGVGILASDEVDLGVESFLRAGQATVAARLQQSPAGITPEPVIESDEPAPVQQPTRPSIVPSEPPTTGPALAAHRPTAPPGFPPTMPPRPTAGATPTAAPDSPTPLPDQALASSLLLLSDPDAPGLTRLDAEMNRSAAGRPVQIRYGEAPLNRELAALLTHYPDLPYHNVRVDLKRDGVVVSGSVTVLGFQVETEVRGNVVARDCLPQAEIEAITIAGLTTPGFVREGIKDIVLESLSWYPANHPLCLEQIVLEEDRVTVYGTRR